MSPDRIHDLCLVKTLQYRAQLNAARAGYPSHTSPDFVAHNEAMLRVWETIDNVRDWSALPPDWQQLLNDAASR